jgi:hypothetical protein
MKVLTAAHTASLRATVAASYEALILVEDIFCHSLDRVLLALTSDRAIAAYRLTWQVTRFAVCLAMAASFYGGVLARHLWERFQDWADGYVAACQVPPETTLEIPDPAELLPDPWETPVEFAIVPVALPPVAGNSAPPPALPPAKIEPTLEPVSRPRRKRGRPKKNAA